MAETQTLHDAFLDELRDAYDAEKQLVKALPKMAKAATSTELRQAFVDHLEETNGHVEKLEQATLEFAYEIFEGDKLLIVGYDESAEIVADWTDNAKSMETLLKTFRKKGQPHLFDALSAVAQRGGWSARTGLGPPEKRTLRTVCRATRLTIARPDRYSTTPVPLTGARRER